MSKKQFEENLNYGDCFNFFGSLFSSLLGAEELEKKLDKKEKNN
jgi:sterol desaturase/sphingolipid hydroxylase (fatty acid hydroxylase superfamily)